MAARRGTVGTRFTIMYAVVFLASGVALLGLAFLFSGLSVSRTEPAGPPEPAGSSGSSGPPPGSSELAAARDQVRALRDQLAAVDAQHARQWLIGAAIAVIVMALVSVLLGRVLAGHVLGPLRTITAATRRISADSLDQRLAVDGPADEVRDLADTIDGLLERLEVSFAAQRRFVANASHELRTPLATMRATLDVAAAKPGASAPVVALTERLRGSLDELDRLLDGLLALARGRHGAVESSAPIDCGDLVRRAVAGRATAAAARDLLVDEAIGSGVQVEGDPVLLARAVENLVDNAIRHNQPGGWFRAATFLAGSDAHIVVESGGPVLAQAAIDRLARPFERAGADRTGSADGSGLGLSIVDAIVTAHGGRLDLAPIPNGGLRAAIVLPGSAGSVRAAGSRGSAP